MAPCLWEAWQLMATAFTKYRLHQSSPFPVLDYYLSSNSLACLSSSRSRAAHQSFYKEKLINLFWVLQQNPISRGKKKKNRYSQIQYLEKIRWCSWPGVSCLVYSELLCAGCDRWHLQPSAAGCGETAPLPGGCSKSRLSCGLRFGGQVTSHVRAD